VMHDEIDTTLSSLPVNLKVTGQNVRMFSYASSHTNPQ